MSKIVVYTSIFGGFDSVHVPTIPGGARYLCFSEGCIVKRPWELIKVKRTEETARRDSRKCKILPHVFIPDADYTIYVDANIETRVSPEKMVEWLGENDIAATQHPVRRNLYEEAACCRRLWPKEPIGAQVEFYEKDGCPKDHMLFAGGFIVRRHTEQIKKFNEMWWEQYCKYSCRDQISFPYALWKTGVTCSKTPTPPLTVLSKEFKYHVHARNR